MIMNSAFTGSNIQNPFWYQKFDLTQIRILGEGWPTVEFHAADNCCLYVATTKAMICQDDIPSIPFDKFKDFFVLVLDWTSMQEAN